MEAESQIKALENQTKALKASYPVAASKMKTYLSKSATLSFSSQSMVRIKFTPTYGTGRTTITQLFLLDLLYGASGPVTAVNEPQDGSGEVVIRIQLTAGISYSFQVAAVGPSPGTFSVL